MDILQLPIKDLFVDSCVESSGPVTECHCGKWHVCIESDYFLDEDEERDRWLTQSKTDESIIIHTALSEVESILVDGKSFASCCNCQGWVPYMEFIVTHRQQITQFLLSLANAVEQAAAVERTFNLLKNTDF